MRVNIIFPGSHYKKGRAPLRQKVQASAAECLRAAMLFWPASCCHRAECSCLAERHMPPREISGMRRKKVVVKNLAESE